jgi:Tfp pilus assembly protein PilF
LFGSLGRTRVESRRYGEAIGLLRRALSLGGDKASLNLDLARCFYERRRYVAALACLNAAVAAGAEQASVTELRAGVETALGTAYQNYRARCGGSV